MVSALDPFDISGCDQEPVQFINSIQPFGILLVLGESNIRVQQASQNSSDKLGKDLSSILGTPVHRIFGESFAQALKSKQSTILIGNWITTVQRYAGQLILEMEPRDRQEAAPTYGLANEIISRIYDSPTLLDTYNTLTLEIQKLTNFDRVMVYKFHEDYHGEVVAETVNPGVDSYLGLHYPASDIPEPARSIFQKNWIRMIPDVEYEPVPIVPVLGFQECTPLDLTKSILRGVSRIHLEYLINMGVGASLTISLLVKGKLWGLIACHHIEPKFVTHENRALCELVGRYASIFLQVEEDQKLLRNEESIKAIYRNLRLQLGQKKEDIEEIIPKGLQTKIDPISQFGIGAALYFDDRWVTYGIVPQVEQMEKLIAWLKKNHGDIEVFHTDSLPMVYPEACAFKKIACGLLAISTPQRKRIHLLYFRPEIIQILKWAGNPKKTVHTEIDDLRLHPRKSFHLWKQTVKLKSLSWNLAEIEAAVDLNYLLYVDELSIQFIDEKREALAKVQTREDVMSILSHDLKNPLASIQLNLELISKLYSLDSIPGIKSQLEHISFATSFMKKMILDILDVTRLEAGRMHLQKDLVEVGGIVSEAIKLLNPISIEKKIDLIRAMPAQECRGLCDKAKLLQVLVNLISNAIKFTPEYGKITVSAVQRGLSLVEFCIEDTGSGIEKDHLNHIFDRFWQARETRRFGAGLGLAIVKGIVEAHGGSVWVRSKKGRGSTFFFTLPMANLTERAA